jgi:Uma2 family endonuclease
MATTLTACTPDNVLTLEILPGALRHFRAMVAEGGPLIKCIPGSLTLVSPGRSHERSDRRLGIVILAICSVLRIPVSLLGSTYFELPQGAEDFGYEPDEGYHIRDLEQKEDQPPDLAVEVVVTNPETKALINCARLKVPEVWVLNVPRGELVFYHLAKRGENRGKYVPKSRSRAFPFLSVAMVMERLADPASDFSEFDQNCREWVEQVLAPLAGGEEGQ